MDNNLQRANSLTRALIRLQFKPLFFILLLGCLLTLQIEGAMSEMGPSEESTRWWLQLSMGLWDLLEGSALFLIMSWGVPKVHPNWSREFEPKPFAKPYLSSFVAESLRQLGKVLLWGLLLIVPGFIRYVQLIFVPYIALFSRRYRAGEVDALEFSTQLTRPVIWKVLAIFLLTTAVQFGLEFVPHLRPELHFWPVRVTFLVISMALSLWTYTYMFVLFERALHPSSAE